MYSSPRGPEKSSKLSAGHANVKAEISPGGIKLNVCGICCWKRRVWSAGYRETLAISCMPWINCELIGAASSVNSRCGITTGSACTSRLSVWAAGWPNQGANCYRHSQSHQHTMATMLPSLTFCAKTLTQSMELQAGITPAHIAIPFAQHGGRQWMLESSATQHAVCTS